MVLDLDGDGIETVGLESNIFFDHNGDGFAGADDGLLAIDCLKYAHPVLNPDTPIVVTCLDLYKKSCNLPFGRQNHSLDKVGLIESISLEFLGRSGLTGCLIWATFSTIAYTQ